MKSSLCHIKIFLGNEQGLTVVEYVIGAAFLVGGLTIFFSNYGNTLSDFFTATINR
ncbi:MULTISPECIES: Flp family type IVb pilin [Vibrio]|uniref:Flp family type IVb pilin n=1 Tax=Vibrio cortegadensis TaxID=1328770 RepID=A0ABV4M143_9VIBR|nr:Flp family type IVb pilin [Vibrio genomosp. F6]TKF20597.1 Flp family type IVb pilin [Vibrio genomosp. F6]